MSEDRLTGLALMYIHRNKVRDTCIEGLIVNFSRKHPHRMKLCYVFHD